MEHNQRNTLTDRLYSNREHMETQHTKHRHRLRSKHRHRPLPTYSKHKKTKNAEQETREKINT